MVFVSRLFFLALGCVSAVLPFSSVGADAPGASPERELSVPAKSQEGKTPARAPSKSYVLAPNDLVEIKVYQEEDLLTRTRIAQDGTVAMPLIDTVKLGGLTVDQAKSLVRQMLAKDFLVNPEATVTILEYSKRRVTVLGEVVKQGPVEYSGDEKLTLQEAIGKAGGYTRLANPAKTAVERMENGRKQIFKVNPEDRNKLPFELLPDDVIIVGQRLF